MAQSGATAGNVVEVVGEVTALRGNETRSLTVGATVSGDDIIRTGADSRVAIVLTHNNARWEIAGNVSKRVSESVAWGLPRQSRPPEVVDQATSAAGRDHERSGAQTGVTATTEPAAAAPGGSGGRGGAKPPAAVAAPASIVAPPSAQPAAPPPPPPPMSQHDDDKIAPAEISRRAPAGPEEKAGGSTGRGGAGAERADESSNARGPVVGGAPLGAGSAAAPDGTPVLRALLAGERKALTACLGDAARLVFTLHVARGKATFELTGGTASARMRGCFERVVNELELPAAGGEASIELRK